MSVNADFLLYLGGHSNGGALRWEFRLVSAAGNKILVGAFDKPAVMVDMGGVQVAVTLTVEDQPVVLLVGERQLTGLVRLEENPYFHVHSYDALRCSFDGQPLCAPAHHQRLHCHELREL